MKKLVIMVGLLLAGAFMVERAFVWYAMARSAAIIINSNGEFWRQQLYLTQSQITLGYDKIAMSSHYLTPSVVVIKPSLHFVTSEGSFTLSAPEVEFVGSFTHMAEFTFNLPPEITLKREGVMNDTIILKVAAAPELQLHTSESFASKEIDAIILDQFKLADNTKLIFNVPIKSTGDAKLAYSPPAALTKQWTQIRYEIYPYLNYFSGNLNRVSGKSGAPLLP